MHLPWCHERKVQKCWGGNTIEWIPVGFHMQHEPHVALGRSKYWRFHSLDDTVVPSIWYDAVNTFQLLKCTFSSVPFIRCCLTNRPRIQWLGLASSTGCGALLPLVSVGLCLVAVSWQQASLEDEESFSSISDACWQGGQKCWAWLSPPKETSLRVVSPAGQSNSC